MILPFVQVGSTIHMMGRKFNSKSAAEKAEAEYIARAEKSAGRRLSMRELVHGVPHAEDRDRHQQMVDRVWYSTTGKPTTEAKPWTGHPLDDPRNVVTGDHRFGTRETREALHAKAKEAYDKRTQKPDSAAEKRREKAIAHAHDVLYSVLFDPSVPMSIVEKARQAVHTAENRSVDDYATDSSELVASISKHKSDRATAIDLEAARARSGQVDQFEQPSEFEPAPPAKPKEPFPDYASEIDPVKQAAMIRENRRALGLDPEPVE